RALEVDLGRAAVLDHGDALFADVDRDEELALRLRKRRAAGGGAGAAGGRGGAWRLTARLLLLALGALALAPLRRLAVGLTPLLRLSLRLRFRRRCCGTGRLAPVAATARSASPPRLGRCGVGAPPRRGGGGFW